MKFLFDITEHRSTTITLEIEAESADEARFKAESVPVREAPDDEKYREVRLIRQTEGPWIYLFGAGDSGFYLDHQDRRDHNVVVFERARGHLFTAEEVLELARRLKEIGLPNRDSWNGVGFGQVSFLVNGRKGKTPMTEGQKALLLAPL